MAISIFIIVTWLAIGGMQTYTTYKEEAPVSLILFWMAIISLIATQLALILIIR